MMGSAETERGVERDFLARVPIFAGLTGETLDRFIAAGSVLRAPAGYRLMHEGEPPRSVFVVCQGELEIRKRAASGAEIRLAVLRAGDCVGEMSLIDIQPRSATVLALRPAVLFRLDHAEIGKLHRSDPASYSFLVMNIAREISRRLRLADQVLADMGVGSQELWGSVEAASQR
jgi:CRP-like cAMP-binding protein